MTGGDHFFMMHLNSANQVDSYEVFEAGTDAAAMVRAQSALRAGHDAAEVWKHGRLVGRVGRGDGT